MLDSNLCPIALVKEDDFEENTCIHEFSATGFGGGAVFLRVHIQ